MTEQLVTIGPMFIVDHVALVRAGGDPTMEQCSQALGKITRIKDAVRYWRGDVLALADTLFQDEASQLLDPEALDERESAQEVLVGKRVTPEVRLHAPSFDHALAAAKLEAEEQVEWLDRARAEGWSARKMGTEIAAAKAPDGKSAMRWWLVVECGTEAKRDKMAERLEAEGLSVKRQEKLRKVPKPKKAKKGPVTARAKRPRKGTGKRR